MERLNSTQVAKSFLSTTTNKSNPQTTFWDFVVDGSRASQGLLPAHHSTFTAMTENLIGKMLELAFHPFHTERIVFEEGHQKLTLTKCGDCIEYASNVANPPIICTISVNVLCEAVETIFLQDDEALVANQEQLKSKLGMSSKALLYLTDAILNNQKQFASKAVEQAHHYFIAKTFPISNFDDYLVDDVLRNFCVSGTFSPVDYVDIKHTLLEQFYRIMFIDNDLAASADFSRDDATRCCAYIIRHMEEISFSDLKHDEQFHGLNIFLGRFFKGNRIQWVCYPNLAQTMTDVEQSPISEILALSLSHNPNLTTIGLLEHFNYLPKLNGALLNAFVENFHRNLSVTNVCIDGSCFESNQLKLLLSALGSHPILRELSLTYPWKEDDEFKELVTCLKAISTIRTLHLECAKRGESAIEPNGLFGVLADYLKYSPPLSQLKLDNFSVCEADINALVAGVINNTQLTDLSVMTTNFVNGQLSNLSFLLAKNPVLRTFEVGCCRTCTHKLSADDINGLANNLHHNLTLKKLALKFAGVESDVDLTNLINAVVNHPFLKTVVIEFPIKLSDAITLVTQSRSLLALKFSLVPDTGQGDLTVDERRLLLDKLKSNKSLILMYPVRGLSEEEYGEMQAHLDSNRWSLLSRHRFMTQAYWQWMIEQNGVPRDVVGEIQNKSDDLYRDNFQKNTTRFRERGIWSMCGMSV